MKKFWVVILCILSMMGMLNWENELSAAEKKYPYKPIIYIIPVEAGGGADIQCRPVATNLGKVLDQPLMVVNKPGGGNSIGSREIHNAKPDGYTIGVGMSTLVVNKVMGILPYDHRDFTILGAYQVVVPTLIASTKGHNFKTVKEVVEFAKANPGKLKMAAGGKGQNWWVAANEFLSIAGITATIIPQEGAGGFTTAQVAGGHVDIGCAGLAEAKSQIDAGNIRQLGTWGDRRPFAYPDIPTLQELGYNVKMHSLVSVIGPPNIPKDITEILVKAVKEATQEPQLVKLLVERNNSQSLWLNPEQTIARYSEQVALYRSVLGKAGLLKEK